MNMPVIDLSRDVRELIESDGMEWCVELWPEGEAETLVFKSELIVAHDPVADINKFLRFS